MGYQALGGNTTGSNNTAVGANVFGNASSATDNTAVGFNALGGSGATAYNTAIGENSISGWTEGVGGTVAVYTYNTAIGNGALSALSSLRNTPISGNIAIGDSAFIFTIIQTAAGSNNNIVIGKNANVFAPTGNVNVRVTGNNNIVIGANQQLSADSISNFIQYTSNRLNIGGAIFGTGLTGSVTTPAGNIGIGTATPGSKLEANGAYTNTQATNAGSGATIDFSTSNLAYSTSTSTNIALQNIKNGGVYRLIITGTGKPIISGTGSFTANGFVFHYTSIVTAPNVANGFLYTFIVMNTDVYYTVDTINN